MYKRQILVPTLTGLPVSVALFASGVGTLIYTFVTKRKVPVYLGSSFAYISAVAVSYTHLDVYKRQIYIWSKSGEQKQISEKQACEAIVPYVKSWLNMIDETCAPIIESGDVRYLLSGEGCAIPSLQELLLSLIHIYVYKRQVST